MLDIRRLVAVGAAALALGLPTLLPAQANADEVRVLDSCVATVRDGETLALDPDAVAQPIIDLLSPLDPLGVLVPGFREAWRAQPPILLPGGSAVITGDAIADAVVERLRSLPVLAPVIDSLSGPLRVTLARTCAITVVPNPPAGQPPSSGSAPPPTAPAQPAQPGAPAGGARFPDRGTMTVLPEYPLGAGYGGYGVPGQGGVPPDGVGFNYNNVGVPQAGADTLAMALARSPGTAEALPVENHPGSFTRPAVLATLVLTLVSTQLVRTWVLRRSEE
jgi:hypothetical protein